MKIVLSSYRGLSYQRLFHHVYWQLVQSGYVLYVQSSIKRLEFSIWICDPDKYRGVLELHQLRFMFLKVKRFIFINFNTNLSVVVEFHSNVNPDPNDPYLSLLPYQPVWSEPLTYCFLVLINVRGKSARPAAAASSMAAWFIHNSLSLLLHNPNFNYFICTLCEIRKLISHHSSGGFMIDFVFFFSSRPPILAVNTWNSCCMRCICWCAVMLR